MLHTTGSYSLMNKSMEINFLYSRYLNSPDIGLIVQCFVTVINTERQY